MNAPFAPALAVSLADLRDPGEAARIEGYVAEQERTIRQTLAMLIRWVEGELDQTRAA